MNPWAIIGLIALFLAEWFFAIGIGENRKQKEWNLWTAEHTVAQQKEDIKEAKGATTNVTESETIYVDQIKDLQSRNNILSDKLRHACGVRQQPTAISQPDVRASSVKPDRTAEIDPNAQFVGQVDAAIKQARIDLAQCDSLIYWEKNKNKTNPAQ